MCQNLPCVPDNILAESIKECLRAEIQHSSEDIEPTHISILGKYCTDLAKWPIGQLCEHRAMAERPDLDDNSTQSRR